MDSCQDYTHRNTRRPWHSRWSSGTNGTSRSLGTRRSGPSFRSTWTLDSNKDIVQSLRAAQNHDKGI